MIFSTTQWLHEDIIIKLPFNNMGGWTVQSRCVFCKNLERNLVSKLWTGKIQPSRSLHTHIFASICDFAHGGGAERTKYAHQQWTRQAHCAHQVLTAELWKFLPFACYEIWMHLSRNHKWNPSKNQAFSWLKSTAITIESLQVEVKKICHRSVY